MAEQEASQPSQPAYSRPVHLQISDLGLEMDEKIASLARRISALEDEARPSFLESDDPVKLIKDFAIAFIVGFIAIEVVKYYLEVRRNAEQA